MLLKLGLNESELTAARMKTLRDSSNEPMPMQRTIALNLWKLCGLEGSKCLGSLDEVKQIESVLGIEINIVCFENFNAVISPLKPRKEPVIQLYLYKNITGIIKSFLCTGSHKQRQHALVMGHVLFKEDFL